MWQFFSDNAFGTFIAFVFVVYMVVRLIESYFDKNRPVVDCNCDCGCADYDDEEEETK